MPHPKPLTFGRALKKPLLVDDTAKRTAISRCERHGRQTVMKIRGDWRLVCCGSEVQFVVPHPISVLLVPFFDPPREWLPEPPSRWLHSIATEELAHVLFQWQ